MLKKAASLVGFPLLCIVAVLHGLLAAFEWAIRNLGWIILFPVAAFSVVRNRGGKTKNDNVLGSLVGATVFYFLATILVNLIGSAGHIDGSPYRWWETNKLIFLGLVATNVFSILYELGRIYWNWLTKKKPDREMPAPVETEAKLQPKQDDDGDSNDNFVELLQELEKMMETGFTEEAILSFIEKVTEIFKKGGLKTHQYFSLLDKAKKVNNNRFPKAAIV